jgi:hypothetical protein
VLSSASDGALKPLADIAAVVLLAPLAAAGAGLLAPLLAPLAAAFCVSARCCFLAATGPAALLVAPQDLAAAAALAFALLAAAALAAFADFAGGCSDSDDDDDDDEDSSQVLGLVRARNRLGVSTRCFFCGPAPPLAGLAGIFLEAGNSDLPPLAGLAGILLEAGNSDLPPLAGNAEL